MPYLLNYSITWLFERMSQFAGRLAGLDNDHSTFMMNREAIVRVCGDGLPKECSINRTQYAESNFKLVPTRLLSYSLQIKVAFQGIGVVAW